MDFAIHDLIPFEMAAFRDAYENNHLPTWKADFWLRVEEAREGLSGAIGAYVFVIQHGNSLMPWYVGKTSAKGGFKYEVFQNHKVSHYYSVSGKRGSAQMLFIPLLTSKGKLSKNSSGATKVIEWVEKRLISFALQRNDKLLNVKDTRLQSEVFVPGVIGTRRRGAPAPDSRLARSIFFGE